MSCHHSYSNCLYIAVLSLLMNACGLLTVSNLNGADTRRDNPAVLSITEIQADFVRAKILAYDIVEDKDGNPKIAVLRVSGAKNNPARKNDGPRRGIEYIPLDPEKLDGYRLALAIYPQRMIVINAAFPYRDQVAEIAKALKLQNIKGVFDLKVPQFRGLVVERRTVQRDGKTQPWEPLPFEAKYGETINPRKFGDRDDSPDLQSVILHEDHDLTMPLPILLDARYPDVRLASIAKTIQQRRGKGRPWELPKEPKIADVPEHILLRMIDTDVIPGGRYQYRIKVRMQNPNWVGRKNDLGVPAKKENYDLVRREADADVEIIEGPFVELNEPISFPQESFLYAVEPPIDPKDRTSTNDLKPGEALLQIHRWLSVAEEGIYKEPIGDWIVANVVVRRGHYVGGKQWLPLPIWSSMYNRYVIRKLVDIMKVPLRGVLIDPTKPGPKFIVVDIEGGKQRFQNSLKSSEDETASEILLLDESGNLQVRSSSWDQSSPERKEREEAWLKWVERTEKDMKAEDRPKPKNPIK